MLDRLLAKSEAKDLGKDLTQAPAPDPEKKYTYQVLDARSSNDEVAPTAAPTPTWSFGNIPLFPAKDGSGSCALAANNEPNQEQKDGERDTGAAANSNEGGGGEGASNKVSHDRGTCADKGCALCAAAKNSDEHEHSKDRPRRKASAANDFALPAQNKCAAQNGEGACNCKKCSASDNGASGGAAQDGHTYTFLDRESYGETSPNFTAPRCAPGGAGSAVLQAGYALPAVTVFPTGTYTVQRNDGVQQTARCRRLAAGLAATRTHENSHAAGARRAAAEGNRAANLPRNFATAAECATALPTALSAYNAAKDPIWENERVHGPGTNPPTAQTFAAENAAGTCTFS